MIRQCQRFDNCTFAGVIHVVRKPQKLGDKTSREESKTTKLCISDWFLFVLCHVYISFPSILAYFVLHGAFSQKARCFDPNQVCSSIQLKRFNQFPNQRYIVHNFYPLCIIWAVSCGNSPGQIPLRGPPLALCNAPRASYSNFIPVLSVYN